MTVRIDDLARELEVKSKAILDVLPSLGIVDEKTHASSLSVGEAAKVRDHFISHDSVEPLSVPSPKPEPELIANTDSSSEASTQGQEPSAIREKQLGEREIVVCVHCRLRQFMTSNGMCRRCRKSLRPAALPLPRLETNSIRSPMVRQSPLPVPRYTMLQRKTSTVYRVPTRSAAAKARATGLPSPRIVMPQTGPRPTYTVKVPLDGAPPGKTTVAQNEKKSGSQDAIAQAEAALNAMRTEESES